MIFTIEITDSAANTRDVKTYLEQFYDGVTVRLEKSHTITPAIGIPPRKKTPDFPDDPMAQQVIQILHDIEVTRIKHAVHVVNAVKEERITMQDAVADLKTGFGEFEAWTILQQMIK